MKKKYKKGYTCGVYDLFHIGHLNLLERCKDMCEYLVVGICDDNYVRKIKNKEPIIGEKDRARIVEALKIVDEVVIIDIDTTNDKMMALDKVGFDVLFSGDDWKGSDRYLKTEEEFKPLGVSIEYLPYTKGISTSMLSNTINNN